MRLPPTLLALTLAACSGVASNPGATTGTGGTSGTPGGTTTGYNGPSGTSGTPGGSSGNTGTSSGNGNTSGGNASATATTGSPSGSATNGGDICAAAASCCGYAWSQGDPTCQGVGTGGAWGSLYASTDDVSGTYGIYQINLTAPPTSTPILTAGNNIVAFTLVSSSPLTFVYLINSFSTQSITLYEATASSSFPLPAFSTTTYPTSANGVAYAAGNLAVGTPVGMFSVPYPPSGNAWGTSNWAVPSGSSASPVSITQLAVDGPSIAAASVIGASLVSASSGDICYTQNCFPNNNLSLGFNGVATDPVSGTLYLVGEDGAAGEGNGDGIIEALAPDGTCEYLTVGETNDCNSTGVACPCTYDSTLQNVALNQAAFVNGTLYVTEAVGGPIYKYTPDAGLKSYLSDHEYWSLTAGP